MVINTKSLNMLTEKSFMKNLVSTVIRLMPLNVKLTLYYKVASRIAWIALSRKIGQNVPQIWSKALPTLNYLKSELIKSITEISMQKTIFKDERKNFKKNFEF